jgi:F420-dependent oxidoreductase-like protein
MRIGINEGRVLDRVDGIVASAGRVAADGFASYWLPQVGMTDALTAIAVAGREVSDLEFGTAVVPTYPRHVTALASQALTVQAAIGNRLVLGIGLSHRFVVEGSWGYSYDKAAAYFREYLTALMPLLRGEAVSQHGDHVTAVSQVVVADAAPPIVVVAALGPRMLAITGELADGTITWCTGRQTLADHVVPSIRRAAEDAGREREPRVIAGLPICVTDEPDAAVQKIGEMLSGYGQIPSYRAMLDREGVEGPADIAIVGDEAAVTEQLQALGDVGVTDFNAAIVPRSREEGARTTALLASLAT